jgi:hypothetical protein
MDPDTTVAKLFASQHGLVTRSQALGKGMQRDAITRRVASGRCERVYPGVTAWPVHPAPFTNESLQLDFAGGPGAVVSNRTAAILWDLPVESDAIDLIIPSHRRASIPGVVIHRADRRPGAAVSRVSGIPVTSRAQTVLDLADILTDGQLRALLVYVLVERTVILEILRRAIASAGTQGRRGAGLLRDLLGAWSTGHRRLYSLLELRLVKTLVAHGLPPPMAQVPVRLSNGRTARVDFAYPHARLVLEADSYRYHSSPEAWSRDRVRNNELLALGWRVLPVTHRDLVTDAVAVADRVALCLQREADAEVQRKSRG